MWLVYLDREAKMNYLGELLYAKSIHDDEKLQSQTAIVRFDCLREGYEWEAHVQTERINFNYHKKVLFLLVAATCQLACLCLHFQGEIAIRQLG